MRATRKTTGVTSLFVAAFACACAWLVPSLGLAQQNPRYTSLKEIRERGVVMQQWETSCAAAAVATVLTYGFSDGVTERYVAATMLERTDVATVRKQGGFSLLDMKHFVEGRGYVGRAFRDLSFRDLRAFQAPIVPIDHFGYNHYVVFNGTQGEEVLLADPAFGNRRMPLRRFEEIWMHGMAFVITAKEKHGQSAN